MHEHALGQLQFGGHQQRGPVDGVKAQDVLGDHMAAGGPERVCQVDARTGVGERGVVVEQRVEPHVEDVLLIPRHGHAPGQPVARERNVAQARADERQRLVAPRARRHEGLALGIEAFERVLKRGELEEVVVLLLARELDVVNRTAVALVDLVLGLEVGAARAVPAFIGALVDEAVVTNACEHLAHPLDVRRVGGADEEVVRCLEQRRQRLEALSVAIGQLLRRDAERVRGICDRLAVLVGAGQEEHLFGALAVMAREHVGGDRRVGVPEVRRGVDVIDRSGDVEGRH